MQNTHKTYIVGIGASAGGLEALTQLVAHLRPDAPCAYVVLQHLSPTYRSMMVEILGRETPLTVREVAHGDVPQPGVIYVVPANHNALIKEGRLQLVTAPPEVVPKPSVNQFLISLAAEEGESAIGVILSGTGSDGVAGLRAIQAAGGFTLAQKPESAKYDGMPRAAIEAGVVDHILTPEEIAQRLPELLSVLPSETDGEAPPSDLLERLLALVREHLQFDFSGYKTGTLTRRIRRREIATGNRDLASYLAWVEANPNELEQLSRDILISVTAFFRDRDAFEVLRQTVRELCLQKQPGSEFRVWVAGCATGEEAYSIAMLFADALGSHLPQYRVQIFATDVDDEALTIARRGIYSAAALSEVPPDQLERHFSPVNHSYEVGKHLRDMIVFARHNLVSDPPFLRLDLVSCRNVLIYFDAPLQAKVLQTFNFGLAKDGYLFLGRSESVTQAEQLFIPIDRRERLFRKSGEPFTPPSYPPGGPLRSPGQRRERKFELLLAALVEHFGATAVLCDANGNIQHSVGHVEEFLEFPAGAAQLALGEATTSLLRGELLSLLHHCRQSNQPQRGRRRKHGQSWVRMSVRPVADTHGQALLVLFTPEPAPDAELPEPVSAPEVSQLEQSEIEDELVATREHLQTLVEEMATTNEEMQALNEEAQAANEELQATNEELEAANEELQATNEELVSLNGELSIKTAELVRLSEEYAHLYDALQFPILVFDRSGQLVRFNMPAQRRFDLRPTAIRQHVSRLKLGMALNELERLLGHALAHADHEEINVEQDGRTLRLGVTPGFAQAGDIITLVVTLIDVTDITQAYAQLAESQARLSALMANTQVLFCMKDLTGAYLFANQRYLEFFGLDANTYAGKTDFTLLPAALAARLWELDMAALRERQVTHGEHQSEQHGARYFLRSAHQMLSDANGQPCALVTEAEDITRAHLAEAQLRIAARLFDRSGEAILVTDAQGMIESANDAYCRLTGYAVSELVGKSVAIFQSTKHSDEFYQAMRHTLDDTGLWQGECWGQTKQGDARRQWLTLNRIDGEDGQCEHYVAVLADGAHIRDAQLRAHYLASHDSLTGLINQTQFQDQLRHALAQARRAKSQVILLHIELEHPPALHATFGAEASLSLFRQAALRLRELLPDGGLLARAGETGMLALLTQHSAAQAQQLASSMVDELAASFNLAGQPLTASAHIGMACYPEDASDSTGLATAAEAAMRHARTLGRNQTAFFQPELQVRLHKHAALNSALREGLRQQRLQLVFQPKFQLAGSRALAGAEALLRWRDPVLGEVSPAEFIPVAENSGLIHALHQYQLRLLCAQLRQWREQGLCLPPITLNVSAVCLGEPRFAASLLNDLREQAIAPEQLHIEISESALHNHFEQVADNLNQLAEAGVLASVDEFGAGHSSLGHLRRLPLTRLKIDGSLIDGLGRNPEDETLVGAVLAMARALKLQTVAAGVTTQAQLDWLMARGCEMAQGGLLAPLQSPAAFAAQLPSEPAYS